MDFRFIQCASRTLCLEWSLLPKRTHLWMVGFSPQRHFRADAQNKRSISDSKVGSSVWKRNTHLVIGRLYDAATLLRIALWLSKDWKYHQLHVSRRTLQSSTVHSLSRCGHQFQRIHSQWNIVEKHSSHLIRQCRSTPAGNTGCLHR